MIASVRALVVLAVLGALLLLALVLDHGGGPVRDRAVLPGFDPAKVTSLAWTGARAAEPRTLVRAGQGWRDEATRVAVEARAVEDVLGSLRGARWHRRGGAPGPTHRTLVVHAAGGQHVIELAGTLAGSELAWLVVDGTPLLVDGWLAAVLDPTPLAFRELTPLAGAASAETITITVPPVATGEPAPAPIVVHPGPWRTGDGLVAPALGDALAAALGNLQLVAAPASPAPSPASTGVTIELAAGPTVRIGGPCAPAAQTAITVGELPAACVDTAAWTAVRAAIDALARPFAEVLDRRPAGFAIDHVELPGGVLSFVRRPTLRTNGATVPADPDRVAELVAALAEPGEPVAPPRGGPAFAFTIAPVRGEPIVLEVFGDVVHRRGEPAALKVSPAARAVLARPLDELRDSERWSEEPSTISTLVLDGVTYRRGAVLGEWMREPAGALEPALVEAVASAVARLRAPSVATAAATPHRLAVTFAPPVGAPVIHQLELAPPAATGCAARIDGQPASAPLALCTAVAALAR